MKKLKALFIGNCQNGGLINFLKKSEEFDKKFETKFYANWQLIENQCQIPMADIQDADVFVYQPLRRVHGCYSTDPTIEGSIGYYVKKDCLKISHPYIFSSAMWPIVQAGKNQNRWFGGEVIDNLVLNEKKTKNEILEMFLNNQIDWNYKNRFKESINILKNKESITDIKISDFILKNYTEKLLFLIPQHPTSLVFLTVANEVLKKLNIDLLNDNIISGINDIGLEDSTYDSRMGMFPLHKSAIIDYNLKYDMKYLENSENFYTQRITTYLEMNHCL